MPSCLCIPMSLWLSSELLFRGLNSGHGISPQIVFGDLSNGTEPIMKSRFLLATFFMSFAVVSPAASYQGLKADYATCTTGQGKVANAKVVQACSRLIKNAAKENEMIGMFYALRASANDDKASNCRDAGKARKLIKNPKLTSSLNALESTNCGNTAVSANGRCMSDRSTTELARGKLEILSAHDAAGRPETAYILNLPTPACLMAEDPEDNVRSTRTVHIFGVNEAVHTRIASLVGRTVVVRGQPFPALTVHHHAPIVMEITKIGTR